MNYSAKREAAKKATAERRVYEAAKDYGYEFVLTTLAKQHADYAHLCASVGDGVGSRWGAQVVNVILTAKLDISEIDGRIA